MSEISYHGAGSITKASRNPDGTVTFEASKAAGPDLDGDQQILDPAWLDKAMGDWFAGGAGGNLREQHGSTAAGKALTLAQPGNGDNFVSGIVVDPVSALKVEHDVLTGLSVGIKGARVVKDGAAPGGRIVGGRIVEVSLVDRPCNPTCKLLMAKSDDAGNAVFTEELTGEADSSDEQIAAGIAYIEARYGTPDKAWKSEASETPDITGARAAIAAILPLVQHEVDGLTAGDQAEQYDVSDLLTALSALTSFLASEVAETLEDKMDDATKAEIAELVKTEVTGLLASSQTELVETLTKALKPDDDAKPVDVQEALKAALAEGGDITKALTDVVTGLMTPITDALAGVTKKVDAIPVGGGPAITRTAPAGTEGVSSEKQELLDYADRPGLDPDIRDRTLAKANTLS